MRRLFTRKNIIGALLALACLIVFLTFYTYRGVSRAFRETRQVDESLLRLRALEHVMDDIQDIESGQRGYAISHDSLFLGEYFEGLGNLTRDTQALVQSMAYQADREAACREFLRLIARKARYSIRNVGLVRNGYYDSAFLIIQKGTGRALMDSIRKSGIQLETADREILWAANQKRRGAASDANWMLVSISLLSLGALLWLSWKLLSEEKLRSEQERKIRYLAGLTEQTSDAIFSTDLKGYIISWNKGAEAMLGYRSHEAIGKMATEVTKSGRTEEDIEKFSRQMSQTGSLAQESVVYHKNGQPIDCLGSVTLLRNSEGDAEGCVVVLRDISERKKNEKLLAEFNAELSAQVEQKTAQLKNVMGRVQEGFYSLSNDKRVTYVNDYAAGLLGRPVTDLLGREIWALLPGAEGTLFYRFLESAFTDQQPRDMDFFYEPLQRWFNTRVYPSASGVSVFFRDITAHKTTEEAIRRSNMRFDLISRTTNDAVWEWNLETGELWGNEMHQRLYGLKPEAPVPKENEWLNRLHPDDKERMIRLQAEALASDTNVFITEYRFRTADRGYRDIYDRCYIVRNEQGKAIKLLGSMMDITERKKAEQAILESEETLRMIMHSALDAIICIDLEGRITVWTPQAEKIFGWPVSEILGRQLSDYIIPDRYKEAHRKGMENYRNGGTGSVLGRMIEITAVNRQGTEFPVELSIIPIRRESGDFFCAFIRDITDRKKAETALKESEQKIRQILSSSADDFYVIDRQFNVVLINENARKNLLQVLNQEVNTGKNILEIFPADRREFIRENYEKVFNGERVEYEFSLETGGKPVWRRVAYSPVRDATGAINGCFVSTTDISERKKAEEDIVKTNARFNVVSKATSDIVWDLSIPEGTLWWNDNYSHNLGYPPDKKAANLEEWFALIHPTDLPGVRQRFLAAIDGPASSWRDEYRYRKSDGSYLHMLDRGYIMRNDQGRAYRMIGSMVDMTPVYEVQRKVVESENRLRAILDTDPECIKLLDASCVLIDINKAGLQMVEADQPEDVIGKNLLTVVSDNHKAEARRLVGEAYMGNEGRLEFEMITLKGRTRWCEVSLVPFLNADGQITCVLGVTRDMTERKKAELELSRNEEKYRTLVEQAADAIALYDAAGKILDVNTGAVILLGYTRDELVAMNLSEVLTQEEFTNNPVRYDILQRGKSTVKQRRMRRKDGSEVETEVRSQQLPDGRFLSIIRDQTERIRAEKELQQYYRQLKELNAYLQNVREDERSNIAREIHDELGQQLTVLKMDISWLNKKLADKDPVITERLHGLIEMIDNTVRSVRRISSELRPSMLDDLGLPAAIEWQAQEFSKRTGLSIESDIELLDMKLPGKVSISLYRVYQESLTNIARHAGATEVKVCLKPVDDKLLLTVTDNGKGFLPKDIDNRKTLGILGMKERVALIGGSCEIESEPGKGTHVRVIVPFEQE